MLYHFSLKGIVAEYLLSLKDRLTEGYIMNHLLDACRHNIEVKIERIDSSRASLGVTIGRRSMEEIAIVVDGPFLSCRLPLPLACFILHPDFLTEWVGDQWMVPAFVGAVGGVHGLQRYLLD